MERWRGRVALVTGAGSGIGLATAASLAEHGLHIIACDKNTKAIQALQDDVPPHAAMITSVKCDLTEENEILQMFSQIDRIDILINCAATAKMDDFLEGQTEGWLQMFDVNIVAMAVCTRETLKIMKRNSITDGHIINLCSIAGHRLGRLKETHFYACTKHMVKAMSEALYRELKGVPELRHTRVTNLSPGAVDTPFIGRWWEGRHLTVGHVFNKDTFEFLQPKDIADSIVYVLGTPPHVCIQEMIILPTEQLA